MDNLEIDYKKAVQQLCCGEATHLPPRSAKPSEGEDELEDVTLSSGSLRSLEVKHSLPPSATLFQPLEYIYVFIFQPLILSLFCQYSAV